MQGFFSKEATSMDSFANGRLVSCAACGLYQFVLSPRMQPHGNFKKRVMVIGEAPGEVEDQHGAQWQGQVGRKLRWELRELGLDLHEDCLSYNAINCRPVTDSGANRTPKPNEINCCRRNVLREIRRAQPHVIILVGGCAVESFFGNRMSTIGTNINLWRGWTIPDREHKAWICPVFHPSYVARLNSAEIDTIWKQDLHAAVQMVEIPFPTFPDERAQVEIITDLKDLRTGPLMAFDYETTGLKPHAAGHRIICASVAASADHAQVFMMPDRSKRQPFLDFLANSKIKKMAHNMKFEQAWSVIRLRQSVASWHWDSMLMAHLLDNRPGITGLKFQTYVHFGVLDYASEVAPYLRSGSKNGNAFNKIQQLVQDETKRRKLLEYCGLDSLFEFKLALLQQGMIS